MARMDRLETALAKQNMTCDYELSGGDVMLIIPGASSVPFCSTETLDDSGKPIRKWEAMAVTPKDIMNRQITGRPLRMCRRGPPPVASP